MILDAGSITAFQQCPRKWLLNQSSEFRRWRPQSLFSVCFREAIHKLYSGVENLESVTQSAVTKLLENSARPGLDTPKPFQTAKSLESILKTSLARVHACPVPRSEPLPHVLLPERTEWACNALFDGKQLHAWSAVDYLSDGVLARQLHSWHVVGDCAASGLPMTLHILEIGRLGANGRYGSAWCRTFAHPIVIHRWAFQQKDGKPLRGKWKPVYFEDGHNDPETWIGLMERDGVKLLHSIPVKQLTAEQAETIKWEIVTEAQKMRALQNTEWKDEPMRRSACDLPVCGWQPLCFGNYNT